MIINLPITNKENWKFLTHTESKFRNYCMNGLNEAIFGICADDLYKHNNYVTYQKFVPNGVVGIEIRWNYNIFTNE